MSKEEYTEVMILDEDGNLYYTEDFVSMLRQENTQLKERTDKVLKLVNTILDLPEDKFCKYDTYLNSINEISKILKGEK